MGGEDADGIVKGTWIDSMKTWVLLYTPFDLGEGSLVTFLDSESHLQNV
jgi:hypothetical protein